MTTVIPINKHGRCRVHVEPVEKMDGEIRLTQWNADGGRAQVGATWTRLMPLHDFLEHLGDVTAVWYEPDKRRVIVERSESFGRSGIREA